MKFSGSSAILLFFIVISVFSSPSLVESSGGRDVRRMMMSFKETPNGGNVTFDCSPSGQPCLAQSDEKYRCSETGYRIPFKCEEIKDSSKEAESKKMQKTRSTLEAHSYPIRQRSLLEDSSTSENGVQAYITYRSCITPVSEERLSVLGFEGIMMGLLMISGSAIYVKRKRANAVPGGAPCLAQSAEEQDQTEGNFVPCFPRLLEWQPCCHTGNNSLER
nr:transmembrane protein, putative [Ipomoea batatas]